MKYRKRPVVIDAVRFTGDNWGEASRFADDPEKPGQMFRPACRDDDLAVVAEVYDVLHDTWVGVKSGQWVIRGVRRETYPCDDAVFRQTYEPVADGES